MLNIHAPARQADETQAQYRDRQRASKAAARAVTTNAVTLHNRRTPGARAQFRDSMRKSGTMGKRIRASDALMAAWASKRVTNWKGEQDKHGAYTLAGGSLDRETGEYIRRKWLAGISAARGY